MIFTINERPVFAAEECRRRRRRELPRWVARIILLGLALTWLLVVEPLMLVLR